VCGAIYAIHVPEHAAAVKKRTDFSDCKVISDVGYNTVYSCPEGIVYVVRKK
jgi:hypothetical protein